MHFTSIWFPLFCLISVALYFAVPVKYQWKTLLIISLVFYAFANPVYLPFLLISIITTHFLMLKPKKTRLAAVLVINLGLLVYFRYNFIPGFHSLIVPLGISFYTFMTLGYALDVYNEVIKPERNLFKYALFISYFPQITQGPIGTYEAMGAQLTAPHSFELSRLKSGGYRMLTGYFKKLVIAGRLMFYVDTVFASPGSYGALTLCAAVFFYAIELYADFSGYMDIAAGLSEILGIRLSENFLRPYFSKTIPEFWRRWHITLNEWFREHLFVPLMACSPNRAFSDLIKRLLPKAKTATLRTMLPLFIVWITTGVWHGASLTYVGWGLYYAIIMMLSTGSAGMMKRFRKRIKWEPKNPFIIIFQTLRTFFIVCLGYIFFRAENINDAAVIFKKIFTQFEFNAACITEALVPFGNGNQAIASVLILGILIICFFIYELLEERKDTRVSSHKYILAAAMVSATALLGVFGQSNFLYQAF